MPILSWGSNSHGQLGQGIESEQTVLATEISLKTHPTQILGGGKHSFIISTNWEVYSCGDNDKGQLGFDSSTKHLNTFSKVPFQVKIIKISCGWDFNLAVSEHQDLLGWGSNSFGQLGLPVSNKTISSPVKVDDFQVIDAACGLRHSTIVRADGLIFTSGAGRKGQLGISIDKECPKVVDSFQKVPNISDAVQVACGENHCLVLTETNDLFAWGDNKYGQLGSNPTDNPVIKTPIKINVPFNCDFKQILSGWTHNLVLTIDGRLISFGRNDYGQLGEKRLNNWKPEILKNLKTVKQCAVGSHHSYVLTEDDEIYSWGWNEHGNCGNGDLTNVYNPVKIGDGLKPLLIGTGAAHSFVVVEEK